LDVTIAGQHRGRTPLTLSLAPATYEVLLGPADKGRTVRVTLAAGSSTVQHIDLAALVAAPVSKGGILRIQTDPTKLPVLVDGSPRGVAPLTLEGVAAGDHEITVRGEHGLMRRSVTVQSGETVSLIVSSVPSVDPTAVAVGWLTVVSPIPLQLRENGKVIGTTDTERLMLTAGDHSLELVNDSLGFQTQRNVRVTGGKTATAQVTVPTGTISLNALPWAEVWIDGERVGQTPIGNLARSIGRHDVVFRHPELGEHRESVVITTKQPVRLGVDLRKK
jgi:hypothetical protein